MPPSCTRIQQVQNVQSQLDVVTKERDGLRYTVNVLSHSINLHVAAGQKRKEPSDVCVKTLDPRKKTRVESLPDDLLQLQIAHQGRQISELECRLAKVTEESRTRRKSDELELSNMRTCLKDLMDKADCNQALVQKLEAEIQLKEKAFQITSVALDAKVKEISAATKTISNLGERLKYVEDDRKYLKADVYRYHAQAQNLSAYYKSQEERKRLGEECQRARKRQYESSNCTGRRVEPQLNPGRGVDRPSSNDDKVNERIAHLPESRCRPKAEVTASRVS